MKFVAQQFCDLDVIVLLIVVFIERLTLMDIGRIEIRKEGDGRDRAVCMRNSRASVLETWVRCRCLEMRLTFAIRSSLLNPSYCKTYARVS